MVLELILNPKKIKGRWWEIFLIGFVYSALAIVLSLWLFKPYAALTMIMLTVIASIPFVHRIMASEEVKDTKISSERTLLKEHSRATFMFLFLFLGSLAAFTLIFLIMPSTMTEEVFNVQLNTIGNVQKSINHDEFDLFVGIFLNNMNVLLFCIIFSFLYGAGAIFILTWNASVIAAAIGTFVRESLYSGGSIIHMTSIAFLRYMLHGIPEIFAYFIGALASGIISFAIIQHEFMNRKFKAIVRDAMYLILLSIIILIIADIIEVFVSPIIG